MKKNVGLIRLTDHSVRDSCCCNFKRLSTISIFWLNTISLTAPSGLAKGRISQGLVWMLWSISYVHVWFSGFFFFFWMCGRGFVFGGGPVVMIKVGAFIITVTKKDGANSLCDRLSISQVGSCKRFLPWSLWTASSWFYRHWTCLTVPNLHDFVCANNLGLVCKIWFELFYFLWTTYLHWCTSLITWILYNGGEQIQNASI